MLVIAQEKPFSFSELSSTFELYWGWRTEWSKLVETIEKGEENYIEDNRYADRFDCFGSEGAVIAGQDYEWGEKGVVVEIRGGWAKDDRVGWQFDCELLFWKVECMLMTMKEIREQDLNLLEIKKKAMIQLRKKNQKFYGEIIDK